MDKDCHSTEESTASSSKSINPLSAPPPPVPSAAVTSSGRSNSNSRSNNPDQYLRHLNKLSHKISKPSNTASVGKPPSFESSNQISHDHQRTLSQPLSAVSQPQSLAQQQQNQPPVYNINKNDFRDVVQKLTGSPAQERVSNPTTQPPPVQASKPTSSRLHRIRPPPLAQISNRPPSLINCHMPPQNAFHSAPIGNPSSGFGSCGFMGSVRPTGAPLSPLPPLPSCHASAESPISAYLRLFHDSVSGGVGFDSDPKRFPGMASPKGNNQTEVNPSLQNQPPFLQQSVAPPAGSSSSSQSVMPPPSSPLPFGGFSSPKSTWPLLSPKLPFSPTGTGQFGFPPFPLSPGVPPVPSPK